MQFFAGLAQAQQQMVEAVEQMEEMESAILESVRVESDTVEQMEQKEPAMVESVEQMEDAVACFEVEKMESLIHSICGSASVLDNQF